MNRKELDALCRHLKECKPEYGAAGNGWADAVLSVSNAVSETTANFDEKKFLKRCGYG